MVHVRYVVTLLHVSEGCSAGRHTSGDGIRGSSFFGSRLLNFAKAGVNRYVFEFCSRCVELGHEILLFSDEDSMWNLESGIWSLESGVVGNETCMPGVSVDGAGFQGFFVGFGRRFYVPE